jgi:glycosyltransferase involved in cell wall biosynthesis
MPGQYAKADLFVLPSRRESFGLVLAEAMAAGLPVIATQVGAIPEVVKDGETGILVPPEDPSALANAVSDLLDHPRVMKDMGTRGRERAEKHFTWDKVAQRVVRTYHQILDH